MEREQQRRSHGEGNIAEACNIGSILYAGPVVKSCRTVSVNVPVYRVALSHLGKRRDQGRNAYSCLSSSQVFYFLSEHKGGSFIMRKKISILLVLSIAAMLWMVGCTGGNADDTSASGGKEPFKVGMECGYPPFNWTQLKGG